MKLKDSRLGRGSQESREVTMVYAYEVLDSSMEFLMSLRAER